ncbi:adhesive domain-containing protein, partial [Floricoccus tropicus]|uniref:adhesive domain-containing protein n=1 Tax=Floricoccus tropicus TaxID=1859473 RepID=UPI000A4E3BBE
MRSNKKVDPDKMGFRKWKSGKQWLYAGAALTIGVVAPLSVSYVTGANLGTIRAYAAVASGSLFNSISVGNDSGTIDGGNSKNNTAYKAGTQTDNLKDVDFTIKGGGFAGASAIIGDRKSAVIEIPSELVGAIQAKGTATVDTSYSVRLDELPVVGASLKTIVGGINVLTGAMGTALDYVTKNPGNIDTNFEEQSQILGRIAQELVQFDQKVDSNVSVVQDGNHIYAVIDDGIGSNIAAKINSLLSELNSVIANLSFEVSPEVKALSIFNPRRIAAEAAVTAAKAAITAYDVTAGNAIKLVQNAVVSPSGTLIDQLANAAVFGDTTVTIPTTIDLSKVDEKVKGEVNVHAGIQSGNLINWPVFSGTDGKTPIYFDTQQKPTKPSDVT